MVDMDGHHGLPQLCPILVFFQLLFILQFGFRFGFGSVLVLKEEFSWLDRWMDIFTFQYRAVVIKLPFNCVFPWF